MQILKKGLHLERFDPSQLLVDQGLRWIYEGIVIDDVQIYMGILFLYVLVGALDILINLNLSMLKYM